MSPEDLNCFLKTLKNTEPLFVFLTGASGAGKTFLATSLEKTLDPEFATVAFFDRIGVPSTEEMIRDFGSGEKWQKAMTHKWIERLASGPSKNIIILEGQFNPQFALDACKRLNIQNYILIDIHTDQNIRENRLTHNRKQPELANPTMENWAQFLKKKTEELGGTVLDNSESDLPATLNKVCYLIKEKLNDPA